jgi:hypothetical protein
MFVFLEMMDIMAAVVQASMLAIVGGLPGQT